MGWFDNEQDQHKSNAMVPQPEPRRRAAAATSLEPGSTMGRQIQVDGTIVCEEDLTILGRVDGNIHAQGTLVIARKLMCTPRSMANGSLYTARLTGMYMVLSVWYLGRQLG